MLYETAITPELSLEERRYRFETEYSEFLTHYHAQRQGLDHDMALSFVTDRHSQDPNKFNDEAELFQLFKSEYHEEFAPGSDTAQITWEHIMATHPVTLHTSFLFWQKERYEDLDDEVSMLTRLGIENSLAENRDIKATILLSLKDVRMQRYMHGTPSGNRTLRHRQRADESRRLIEGHIQAAPEIMLGKAVMLAAYQAYLRERSLVAGMTVREAGDEWRRLVQNPLIDLEREAEAWVKSGLAKDGASLGPYQWLEQPSN